MTFADARLPFELRRHQADCVAAHQRKQARPGGAWRSHLVLPPGAGKTAVGAEIARREGRRTLILVPNTAIQAQWLELWSRMGGVTVGHSRDLATDVTVLTYQAIATFDPDADDDAPLTERLHPDAVAMLESLHDGDPFTLVLDEAHHLLQTWGQLLDEFLADAGAGGPGGPLVIALTATPRTRLTPEQAGLGDRLFGEIIHEVSTPALVRDGVLAPFREMVWFVEPTQAEQRYLAESGVRWQELITDLLDPGLGFLDHIRRQWVEHDGVSWARIDRDHPDIARAVVRLHADRGLVPLPEGARVTEETRQPMVVEDWAALIDDYTRHGADDPTREAIAAALPAVGYRLTRQGVRRGRSSADRVLARSTAKAVGAVTVLRAEAAQRGADLRACIVTDVERAPATPSARLSAVDDGDSGSAWQVLRLAAADPVTAQLRPILMTARSCVGTEPVMRELADGAGGLELHQVEPGLFELVGPGWQARRWVPVVTDLFLAGGTRLLIGTRGLLGEGWDASALNVLIDLTAATTPTAVVQVRGRAVRRDPLRPDKVAHIYSAVCVADGHPLGDRDYRRFVRKHEGYWAADAQGRITPGVGHVAEELTPYGPPRADERRRLNAEMERLVGRSAEVPALWGVGRPYVDAIERVVRVTAARQTGAGIDLDVPAVAAAPSPLAPLVAGGAGLVTLVVVLGLTSAVVPAILAGLIAAAAAGAGITWRRRSRLAAMSAADTLAAFGGAVAEAMGHPAHAVRVAPSAQGWSATLPGTDADRFAAALEQVLSPPGYPRYLISRRLPRHRAEQWHAVPDEFGRNRGLADGFAAAWHRQVSPGRLVYTGSPDGAGILAAVHGSDPLDVACAVRSQWI